MTSFFSTSRRPRAATGWRKMASALIVAGLLAGCQADELGYGPKHLRPVSADVKRKMEKLGVSESDPILIRIFKEESALEVWKRTKSGKFALLDTFEICKWSGELGPKFKEGDRQAPEGFYEITPALMNPNSSYHLAFNTGYPNRFDRAHGRTGSNLMVHGACSSRGCYSMTDAQVQDIYALARDAFRGGQRSFQVQAFPFRMTPENMAKHRKSEHIEFWRMLKVGYDHFEVTKRPPKVDVCEKKYVFDAVPLVEGAPFNAVAKCPAYKVPEEIAVAVNAKQSRDEQKFTQIVASLERREKREQDWKETESRIAKFLGGGKSADETLAVAASETAAPSGATGGMSVAVATSGAAETVAAPPVATAFADGRERREKTSGFFGRLLSFGGSDNEQSSQPDATLAVAPPPTPKPGETAAQ